MTDVAEPKTEVSDDFENLDHLDLGEIDPESYVQSEDDGCEGGACKI